MRTTLLALCLLTLTAQTTRGAEPKGSLRHTGAVPDQTTAIKIAVAAWEPIYGADHIARQKPFHAKLRKDGVWLVTGSLPKQYTKGGVALAEIAKADGRILHISHGK
jgi:hypothetical protein